VAHELSASTGAPGPVRRRSQLSWLRSSSRSVR
jgi:hypothetical protein